MANACYETMGEEVTMEEALNDDTLHDVTLEGSDGVRVPAMRGLLALRSKVFRKMLQGSFQEATQEVVKVEYPGAVVKAVVEYIYTDKPDILSRLEHQQKIRHRYLSNDPPVSLREDVQTLLTISAAAAFFNLPRLCNRVNNSLGAYIPHNAQLSFAVVEAYVQEQAAITGKLKREALDKIGHFLERGFLDSEAKVLSPSGMELILSHFSGLESSLKFHFIDMWSSAADDTDAAPQADKKSVTKSLIEKHVKLALIERDRLLSSGLLTKEELAEICQRQRCEEFNSAVSNPVWKNAKSNKFLLEGGGADVLQSPALKVGGSYRWTVKVSEAKATSIRAPIVWLGIISLPAKEEFLGIKLPEVYEGEEPCDGEPNYRFYSDRWGFLGEHAIFRGGETVTMSLDLSASKEENNGSLSMSVAGNKPSLFKFGDILSNLKDVDGFVPCVRCTGGDAMVKILSMEQTA